MGNKVPDHSGARWFKSSYSAGNAQCVEAAFVPGHRLVRDSKLGESSPLLEFSVRSWQALILEIKSGKLDLG
ncbi:DUF397 domain-containing protein [Saccharopolyspora phatthalungensis]|uniref:DUF397 domain-containing protein n=1 Tax=Saccharopolyspora phatthalungensis TaxID=664693 RepID=A0A840Q9N8_9PSEU|nr:DUF397 domain-containing protein [Saccharopolyspora phatthalungensis]MBB5157484.1 hypothetical protein [Saccharopolyspora phatthalungensis]